jgi:hypothetical protein
MSIVHCDCEVKARIVLGPTETCSEINQSRGVTAEKDMPAGAQGCLRCSENGTLFALKHLVFKTEVS